MVFTLSFCPAKDKRFVLPRTSAGSEKSHARRDKESNMNHSAVEWAREIIGAHLKPGGVAIDGTAGNGRDTLFLAETAGPAGRIYALDCQAEAIDVTRTRLRSAGCQTSVTLLHAGHEKMAEVIPARELGRVQAAMFNLGYLPGGDKKLITRPETTIAALTQTLDFLAPAGALTIVCYPGHPGGASERNEVKKWAQALDSQRFFVLESACINNPRHPPVLMAVEKKFLGS